LDAGADKVSINSAALARPELIDEMARVFGSQCVVLAVDAKSTARGIGQVRRENLGAPESNGVSPDTGIADRAVRWEPYLAGGRIPTGRDVIHWTREAVERGAGEILLTSMDRDGTSDGYDLELTRAVSEAVGVPVIASGGAGELEHLAQALRAGADAALCASIFHYGRHTIPEAKDALLAAGVHVRAAASSPSI